MPTILPRLRNLLAMLAREPEPLPVREVASRLGVSRRTVFRELANVDAVLHPYGLLIGSRSGEGVLLEGPAEARTSLLRDLDKLDPSSPADRRDRQDRLALAIFQTPGGKLSTYGEILGVSAATISHDLDDIEPRLAERRLSLTRKAGQGVSIDGDEMAVRQAILALTRRIGESSSYPHPDILLDILDLAPELDPVLGWMTPQSRDGLHRYLAVMAQRVMDGNSLGRFFPRPEYTVYRGVADRLAVILGEAFNIDLRADERNALMARLAACRPNIPNGGPGRDDPGTAVLAAAMIDRFDPDKAPFLRMDEVLLDGLAAHLRTAVVRIRHGMEVHDPMRDEIASVYPDILERSRAACRVLEPFGDCVPEDEVSLVAAHFGAALLRLDEQNSRRRTLRVGIICVHGIGSSYLLASQVKQSFSSRVVVEVGWQGDPESWSRSDLLISTTPLSVDGLPVLVVSPILRDDDLQRIDDALGRLQAAPDSPARAPAAFSDSLRDLEHRTREVRVLTDRLAWTSVPNGVLFPDLAAAAGLLLADSPAGAEAITRDLTAREAISTQVVPELGIVLLHCRTAGVTTPRFGVIVPEGGSFGDGYFQAARSAAVMLAPRDVSQGAAELMGCLSAALIEEEPFLTAVRDGDMNAVGDGVRRVLGAALFQFSMRILKG